MLKKISKFDAIANLLFIIYSAACALPLLLVLLVSITNEKSLELNGYSFFPAKISFSAYSFIFKNPDVVLRSYGVTIFVTIVGSALSLLITALLAYPLSRKDFRYRNQFTFFVFFTMLFSGGMVPWYIVCVLVLHLKNTLLALILPYLVNAWYVIIMRTFYSTNILDSILESARIDGAGELRTFFTIVMPLSLPGLATIGLFNALVYWNDWWLPLMLITDDKLFNLQYSMYKVEMDIQFLLNAAQRMGGNFTDIMQDLPTETSRMAMCILAIGPIILAYPILQKYFIKGLTVGAVKG